MGNRLAIEFSAWRSREVVTASIHDLARESGIIAVANIGGWSRRLCLLCSRPKPQITRKVGRQKGGIGISHISFTIFLLYPFSFFFPPRFLLHPFSLPRNRRGSTALHFYRRIESETGKRNQEKKDLRKRTWQSAIGDRPEDVKLQSAVTARSFAREQQVIHHNQQHTKRTGKWMDNLRVVDRPSSRDGQKSFSKSGFPKLVD